MSSSLAQPSSPVELTVVMPCLNEEETLAVCIDKAKLGFERAGVQGEVLIADNGSTDRSAAIAEEHGARVVPVSEKGYGAALRGGITAAAAPYVIMGDADDSYDFSESGKFLAKLREGYDLVMGCRLPSGGGTIMPGAMPWKNRWLGNPVLSFLGRLFFQTPVRDFHCGLRAFSRAAYERMQLKTTGMEFASEMVMSASNLRLRITEVPITLHKDGRSRPPHLRPWRDGWRHLRFMLIYSPRWLFLVPGLVLASVGGIAGLILFFRGSASGTGDLNALVASCAATVAGVQLVAFAFFTKVFGLGEGLLPEDSRFTRVFRLFTLERGAVFGVLLLLGGVAVLLHCLCVHGFMSYSGQLLVQSVREMLAGVTLLVLGLEVVFSSFFMSVLGLKTVTRKPPDPGVE
jgi:glycosyltransferase involved in cell wall biosynthesis